MNLLQKASQALRLKTKNSAGDGMALASQFLRYGNRRQLVANWAQLTMSDRDMYTGYFFGATNKRANGVVELAENNIKTRASQSIMDKAKANKQVLTHPYLDVIDMSNIQNDDFYYNYSTYMDLEGVCYLLVVRNILRGKDGKVLTVGAPQSFQLLSPYNVTAIRNPQTNKIAGYQEYRGGLVRDLPPEMIIPFRRLNPFNDTEPFGIADAAKDSQFMLKSSADFTNNAIQNNINSPGIISTGVELPQPLFENFRQRILSHEKGEPLFGNGSGKIDWASMQSELEHAALDKINDIGLTGIIASTGVSKTSLGIEQSGVTRDTSDVQHDQLISDHVMPQLRKFLNALNQDYRNYYPDEYKKTQYTLYIDNPLGSDREAEQMDVTIRQTSFTLYTEILAEGYTTDLAAKYASGEIALEELGEPTNKPEPQDIQPEVDKPIPEAQVDVPAEKETPPADKKDTKGKKAKKDKKQSQDNSYRANALMAAEEQALTGKVANQVSARDFPDIYEDLGIDFDKLGCIMQDVEPVKVLDYVPDAQNDLIEQDGDDTSVPGEDVSHVTLLFGLLENGNTWSDKVDRLLDGWKPGDISIKNVSAFELPDSYAIVGHIKKTAQFVDGHDRLTLLPHINTFSEYKPHMTLAYIKKGADVDKWVSALGKQYNGAALSPIGINYGDKEKGSPISNAAPVIHAETPINHEELTKAQKVDVNINIIKDKLSKPHGSKVINRTQISGNAQTDLHEGTLKALVVQVQQKLIAAVINKVSKNAYDQQSDIVDEQDKQDTIDALDFALVAFYTTAMPLAAAQVMRERLSEFAGLELKAMPVFTLDKQVRNYIAEAAKKASVSHIDTILNDVLEAVRKVALEGVSRDQITQAIRTEFTSTSTTRADLIAKTESYRAINRSQFDADRQFLDAVGKRDVAMKQWTTHSDSPCSFCEAKAAEGPIPFDTPFAEIGDSVSANFQLKDGGTSTRILPITYETIQSGNLHPRCSCDYELIIPGGE